MKRFLDRIFPSTAASQEHLSHAAGPSAAAAGRSCQECGAGASAHQDWCLECGSRIEDTGTRWHQPAAVMASVALIFLAGLALALSEVAKDAEIAKAKTVRKMVAAAPPPVPQVPDVPTAPGPNTPTLKAPPKTSKNDTDDSGPPAAATPADPGSSAAAADAGAAAGIPGAGTIVPPAAPRAKPAPVVQWPAGEEAWTVALLTTTSKADAARFARRAMKKGIEAGILAGRKYEGFADAVWLVWAGRFGTEAAALKAAEGYRKKGFKGETTEKITKKTDDDDPSKGKKDDPKSDKEDTDGEGSSGSSKRNDAPTSDGG